MIIATLLLLVQAQQCTLPANVPQTRPTRVDYRNANVTTDYYALALSWSPQFCSSPPGRNPRQRWQCRDNSFGFVVHGLWPQSARARNSREHPRHCKPPEELPAAKVRPYLCMMPDPQLVQDEWLKHGTCAWPNAEAYLQQTSKLWNALKLPDLAGGDTTAGEIRRQIVNANRATGLRPEHVQIRVNGQNQFTEAMVCYDKQFRYTACQGPGTPDRISVGVAPRQRR